MQHTDNSLLPTLITYSRLVFGTTALAVPQIPILSLALIFLGSPSAHARHNFLKTPHGATFCCFHNILQQSLQILKKKKKCPGASIVAQRVKDPHGAPFFFFQNIFQHPFLILKKKKMSWSFYCGSEG